MALTLFGCPVIHSVSTRDGAELVKFLAYRNVYGEQQKMRTRSRSSWGNRLRIGPSESPRRFIENIGTQRGYILFVSIAVCRCKGCSSTFGTWAQLDSGCVIIVIVVVRVTGKGRDNCQGWRSLELGLMRTLAED
jgi:hypothetical protein